MTTTTSFFSSLPCLLLLILPTLTQAFIPSSSHLRPLPARTTTTMATSTNTHTHTNTNPTRRGLLQDIGRLGLGIGLLNFLPTTSPQNAFAADTEAPIAIIGARGKTGKLIVKDLLSMGKKVRALSYQPFTFDSKDLTGLDAGLLTYAVGDVTKPETLPAAVRGASAVVFASSASKKGGDAKAVDCLGVENIARACIDEKIPRLLVISSGAVSRPDSFGYKITNLFGGIMAYKFQGEEKLRALYASEAPKGVTYTIVRPGGLSNDAGLGPTGIELNQKDTIIGEISRVDVAATSVNALFVPDAENVTLEVYEIGRRTKLEPRFEEKSGYERRGGDWPSLFKGLKKDSELV